MNKILVIILSASFLYGSIAGADTLHLKSGAVFKGVVKKDGKDQVEFDTGFGTVVFARDNILRIVYSSKEELTKLHEELKTKRAELKDQEEYFSQEREKRFTEYERWSKEADRIKEEASLAKSNTVQASRDPATNQIILETVLNGTVKATLELDTGAAILLLTKKKGEELGIDLSDRKKNISELRLAGGKTVQTKTVILDTVSVQGIEEKDVKAAILLDDVTDVYFYDGLLGRSFLSRFNMNIDLITMKVSFEKLGKKEEF